MQQFCLLNIGVNFEHNLRVDTFKNLGARFYNMQQLQFKHTLGANYRYELFFKGT
jgi:hypothetical protein